MRKRRVGALAVLLSLAWIAVAPGGAEDGSACVGPYPLATLPELLAFPSAEASESAIAGRLHVLALPTIEMAVILRPISQSEFASYQVQAIDAQPIDLEMLAATMVFPVVTAEDVAGFTADLVAALHRAVNEISGFIVFDDVLEPGGG
jgi:hypothetical protein